MNNAPQNQHGNTRVANAVQQGLKQVNADFAVGNVHKPTEKSFKRRMARFAHSNAMLILALLMTSSAILTGFRPYLLPINAFLVAERAVMAVCLWIVFATGGKHGMGFMAWLGIIETIAVAVMMAFFAAFIGCGMFAQQLLLTNQEDLVRTIKGAGMWAVVPALLALAVAYCVFLFKRFERLVCCNLRDSLRYGFAFDRGSYMFARNCVIVAVAMPVLYIIRGSLGDFEGIKALSDGARTLYNTVLPMGKSYWLNLAGVIVHSATLLVAGALLVKYSAMVKRFKEQKEAARAVEEANREGIKELTEIETASTVPENKTKSPQEV